MRKYLVLVLLCAQVSLSFAQIIPPYPAISNPVCNIMCRLRYEPQPWVRSIYADILGRMFTNPFPFFTAFSTQHPVIYPTLRKPYWWRKYKNMCRWYVYGNRAYYGVYPIFKEFFLNSKGYPALTPVESFTPYWVSYKPIIETWFACAIWEDYLQYYLTSYNYPFLPAYPHFVNLEAIWVSNIYPVPMEMVADALQEYQKFVR